MSEFFFIFADSRSNKVFFNNVSQPISMTYRHHLLVDSIVQALLIIFFSFLLARSSAPPNILQLLPISLFSWQFINGVVSYKFFERTSKKLFVRISGYCLIGIFAIRGILFLASKITPFMQMAMDLTEHTEPFLLSIIPFFCAALALWYLYITFRDLYNMMYNTI
jgi:hypothetical protein